MYWSLLAYFKMRYLLVFFGLFEGDIGIGLPYFLLNCFILITISL